VKVLPSAPDLKLEKAEDAVGLIAQTINQVRRGEIDPKIANSVGYLANLLLRALRETETERRVGAVEEALRLRSDLHRIQVEEDDDGPEWRPSPVKPDERH
jgi:hypothetical protein